MSTTEKIKFPGKHGIALDAKLSLPEQEPIAFALLAHCFGTSKEFIAEARISEDLTQRGIAVFRFDFTGLGKSGGNFADANFSSTIDDTVEASNYLRKHYQAPSLLIGHSWGGTAILKLLIQELLPIMQQISQLMSWLSTVEKIACHDHC